MIEYTSLEVGKRLRDAGFDLSHDFENVAHMYGSDAQDEDYDSSLDGVYGYRSDTLLAWLMTKPFFSRRTATIDIAYRAVNFDGEEDVCRYFVTALNGAGDEIGLGEAPTLPDALAGAALMVLETEKAWRA